MRVAKKPAAKWGAPGSAREVSVLLPVALVLLLGLTAYSLFSLSSALELLAEERRAEVARVARRLAERLDQSAAREEELRRLGTEVIGAALVSSNGDALIAMGDISRAGLLALVGGQLPTEAIGLGFGTGIAGRVIGLAPLTSTRPALAVRVDVAAGVLERQLASLALVQRILLGIGVAVLLLVLLFVRQLVAPIQRLLSEARRVELAVEPGEDEVGFLVRTFERAVLALEEQRQGTHELQALERALAGSLDSGLLLLDEEARVLALNPFGAQVLGVPAPAPGTPLAAVLGADSPLVALLAALASHGGGLKRREVQVGGTSLGLTAHPLHREDGSRRGFLVLFSDLTTARLQDREARLAESLAQLGEMAAGVAHELRNGLATISGYLSLADRGPSPETLGSYLEEIRRETEQLARVVDDFLAFARPGTARPELVDLASLLRRVASHPSFHGQRIELRLSAAAPLLSGDPQLLERTLRNLVANAVEAEKRAGRSPAGAEIVLEATAEQVDIRIEDRGAGLPEEVRRRLFQPFASGHPGGVGLGLALAHRIVSLHGGRLHLDDREGGGTVARLNFPVTTLP